MEDPRLQASLTELAREAFARGQTVGEFAKVLKDLEEKYSEGFILDEDGGWGHVDPGEEAECDTIIGVVDGQLIALANVVGSAARFSALIKNAAHFRHVWMAAGALAAAEIGIKFNTEEE